METNGPGSQTHFRSLGKMTSSNFVFSTFSRLVFANLHLNYSYQTQCISTTIFRLVDITFKQETPEPDSTLHQEQKLHFLSAGECSILPDAEPRIGLGK